MELLDNNDVVLGNYRIVECISAGGQGFGFRGLDDAFPQDRPWEKDVFIKQYHDLPPTEEALTRLKNTVDLIRPRLADKSQYICLPSKIGISHNSIVFIFPWVHGAVLKALLETGNLTFASKVRFAVALAKSVDCLHRAELIHLDLKPDNVMIQERKGEFYVQMIDLDSARIDGIGLRDNLMGTDGYCSPEHMWPARYGAVGKESDVFSLAILITELLTGTRPFESPEGYAASVRSGKCEIPEIEGNSPVKEKLQRLLRRCLLLKREKRPTTRQVLACLRAFRDSLTPTSNAEPTLSSASVSERKRPTLVRASARKSNLTKRVAPPTAARTLAAKPADPVPEKPKPPEKTSAPKVEQRLPLADAPIPRPTAANKDSNLRVLFGGQAPNSSFQVSDCRYLGTQEFQGVSGKPHTPLVYLEIVEQDVFLTKVHHSQVARLLAWLIDDPVRLNGQRLSTGRRTLVRDGDSVSYGQRCFAIKIEKASK